MRLLLRSAVRTGGRAARQTRSGVAGYRQVHVCYSSLQLVAAEAQLSELHKRTYSQVRNRIWREEE
jgi:hypothetical protein